MEGASLQELMRRHGIQPKRSLAQNFLADESHLARIAAAADLDPGDRVLEIGPGLGALTRHLASRAGRVVAVELDSRLIGVLQERFAATPQVEIVQGDILSLDPAAVLCLGEEGLDSPYKVVANLPYYITSAILRHLLESAHPPQLIVVLVQREVARRICAQPGALSLLAVSVQFYARPRLLHTVPAGAFVPAPKVESAVLRLDRLPEPAVADVERERYFQVVRAGFGQKRKQLINSLSAGLGLSKVEVAGALSRAQIDAARRAQSLSLAEWGRLCVALDTAGRLIEPPAVD